MEKLLITGGEPLKGEVKISGAKNSVLPILAASLLCDEDVIIGNVPHLQDVTTTISLLTEMGATLSIDEKMKVSINASSVNNYYAPYEMVKTMRASILVLGPLLAHFGQAKVSLPGGCAIGSRPVNLHIEGLKAMGANINVEDGYINAKAKKLKGAKINFPIATVTGTENIMMAAVLASGKTVIKNAAKEPEIIDLANCLRLMGAKIEGDGTPVITIEGVKNLKGCSYDVLPDRIETATFLVAAAITKGDLTLTHTRPDTIKVIIEKLKKRRKCNSPLIVTCTDYYSIGLKDIQALFKNYLVLRCYSPNNDILERWFQGKGYNSNVLKHIIPTCNGDFRAADIALKWYYSMKKTMETNGIKLKIDGGITDLSANIFLYPYSVSKTFPHLSQIEESHLGNSLFIFFANSSSTKFSEYP